MCRARYFISIFFVKENQEYVKVSKAGVVQLANTKHKCCDLFTLYCVQVACACCLLLFLKEKGKLATAWIVKRPVVFNPYPMATEAKLVSCFWNFFEKCFDCCFMSHACYLISVYLFCERKQKTRLALHTSGIFMSRL